MSAEGRWKMAVADDSKSPLGGGVQVDSPSSAETPTIKEPLMVLTRDLAARTENGSPQPVRVPEIPPPPSELPALVSDATDFLRFQPARKLGWRAILIVVLVVALVAGVIVWWELGRGNGTQRAHVAVTASTAKTVVTLTGGVDNLAQLRQSLDRNGHGNLISPVPGGAVEVNADIVVGRRGELNIVGAAVLLRSDAKVAVRLSAQEGGTLNLTDDTISSWTAQGAVDANPFGGRADIVATGQGSELKFTNCDVVALGTDTNNPGVSWRNGANGSILDSHFSQNWRGAYAYKSGPLAIVGSSFKNSQEDGVLLLDPGSNSTVENSTFADNAQSGLEINGTRGTLTLSNDTADNNHYVGVLIHAPVEQVAIIGGLFYQNEQFGISANGGQVSVDNSKLWSNGTGLSIEGGTTSVSGSDLSSNTQDGLYVSGSASSVVATSDRFDHNSSAGLWVADGHVTVTSGLFSENLNGIRVAGFSRSFDAAGNTISGNIKDGVAIDVAQGLQIHGNVIEDNGNSAISTNKADNIEGLIKQNSVHGNGTSTRVRASD